VTDDELLELLIAANYPSGGGLAVGDPNWREEATEFEITFDQFALWMISSSSLADRLRTILGGPLEQAFSIDGLSPSPPSLFYPVPPPSHCANAQQWG
jgi:hypothetical protein